MKYRRRTSELGWGPRTRLRFGYFTPDDYYEALVAKLVHQGSWWADVGCGRHPFPSNTPLANVLTARAAFFFGIDPDPSIRENPYIADAFQGPVEACDTHHRFDVVTLRMVAEHITSPEPAIRKLSQLTKPGGLVVVYTPNRWAPASIAASLVPNRLHHPLKRLLWNADERDTFPTAYKLNTRRALARHFAASGMEEVYFAYLDDCRTFAEYRALYLLELWLQKILRRLRIPYPENCLLAAYQKRTEDVPHTAGT
jgi:SAM-dependent methyltransferase